MPAKLPRVALLIETSRTYGRGILRGIAHYAHVHRPWSFFTEERELHSGIPERLPSWNVDGIIARIEGKRMAEILARCGCPVVDVLGNTRFKGVPGFDTEHRAVAKLAADFFLNAGFQHFAFCGYPGIPFSDRREDAFRNYLAAHCHDVQRAVGPSPVYVARAYSGHRTRRAGPAKKPWPPGCANSHVRWRSSRATTFARNRCSTPAADKDSRCPKKWLSWAWTTTTCSATSASRR